MAKQIDHPTAEDRAAETAEMRERNIAVNREKAEQIARQIVDGSNWIQPEERGEFLDVATAAALAALTEKAA